MSIHDIDDGVRIRVHKRATVITVVPPEDDDLRRMLLGVLAMLKRRFPNDWRRMVKEMDDARAA